MGLKDSLVSMMGDFVELRRNPEFRSKNDISAGGCIMAAAADPSGVDGTGAFANHTRRHSLQITCGTQESEPTKCVHQRTFSASNNKKDNNSRGSSSLRKRRGKGKGLWLSSLRRGESLDNDGEGEEEEGHQQMGKGKENGAEDEQQLRNWAKSGRSGRRASEPVNNGGRATMGRTAKGHQQPATEQDIAGAGSSPSPPSSPTVLVEEAGHRQQSSSEEPRTPGSLSRCTTFAKFFAQLPIEEEDQEELEWARRQSQSGNGNGGGRGGGTNASSMVGGGAGTVSGPTVTVIRL